MKTLVELTAELQALFSGPEKWTQGEGAKDKNGAVTDYCGPDARCFCLLGGIWRVVGAGNSKLALTSLCKQAIFEIDGGETSSSAYISVAYWQDKPERNFADIQKVLAKMAEIAAR